jgi:hypothetical protein
MRIWRPDNQRDVPENHLAIVDDTLAGAADEIGGLTAMGASRGCEFRVDESCGRDVHHHAWARAEAEGSLVGQWRVDVVFWAMGLRFGTSAAQRGALLSVAEEFSELVLGTSVVVGIHHCFGLVLLTIFHALVCCGGMRRR